MKLGLAALVVLSTAAAAQAAPQYTTKYTYYTINGDSAGELYNAMLRRGPHVNGAKAYASTSATSKQEGKLLPGKSCKIVDYKFSINFTIKLPKLKSEGELKGATRTRWQAFSGFLKKHEETHRSIWLDCARDLERQVRSIRAGDCGAADRQAEKLWDKIRVQCNRRHDAFDAAEQKRLVKHPFVRLVIANATSGTRGAPSGKKKRKRA